MVELEDARGKLAWCRQIMETNDPLNAEMIFGPPLPTAKAEEETPKAELLRAAAVDMAEDLYL